MATFTHMGTAFCPNKSCPSHTSAPSSSSVAMGPSLTASDLADWEGEGGGAGGNSKLAMVPHFNFLVSLSDCTGQIEGVWLGGQAAKEILRDSVRQNVW